MRMPHSKSAATLKIIILYLLSNLDKLTATSEGSISPLGTNNNEIDDISSFDSNEPPNKRSYTYASEFKRLPVFNFGLGKRQSYGDKRIKPYSFGLGKRSRGYTFGLGKKSDPLMDLDYPQLNSYESYFHPDVSNMLEEKRSRLASANNRKYNFGLGKRSLELASAFDDNLSGNLKRANEEPLRKYYFGLGKKSPEYQEVMMS